MLSVGTEPDDSGLGNRIQIVSPATGPFLTYLAAEHEGRAVVAAAMANKPPLPVVINRNGGLASRLGDKLAMQVQDAFDAVGAEIALRMVDGDDVTEAVQQAQGDTVVVGGGDGTISAAAGVLANQNRCLAVLPLGTLNHFAQAIGLDGTLAHAADVACRGEARRTDFGLAGDRVFINNASFGIYPRMVRDRDRLPLPKWLATIPAAVRVLWRPGSRKLRISIDGRVRLVRTPLLFVGNNRYSLGAGAVGQRESLEDGVLSLYAVTARSGPGLVAEALRILRGKADREQDFATLSDAREVLISRSGRHPVALDGEVVRLMFPLKLSIRPKALWVMRPRAAEAAMMPDSPDPR
jgi:diacylglycerol kinase family enzyme